MLEGNKCITHTFWCKVTVQINAMYATYVKQKSDILRKRTIVISKPKLHFK